MSDEDMLLMLPVLTKAVGKTIADVRLVPTTKYGRPALSVRIEFTDGDSLTLSRRE